MLSLHPWRSFDVLIPSCNKKTQSLITTAIFKLASVKYIAGASEKISSPFSIRVYVKYIARYSNN